MVPFSVPTAVFVFSDSEVVFAFSKVSEIRSKIETQSKPLNVITLSRMKTDNINQMVSINGCYQIVVYSK